MSMWDTVADNIQLAKHKAPKMATKHKSHLVSAAIHAIAANDIVSSILLIMRDGLGQGAGDQLGFASATDLVRAR